MPKLDPLDISFPQNQRPVSPLPKPVAAPAATDEAVTIKAADTFSSESLQRVENTAKKAVEYFRANFGPVNGPLNFEVGGAGLRTGYNPGEDTIFLPELGNVKNAGLESEDVINHEIFHALVLNAYPELPKPGEAEESGIAMHEALADYFAYQLSPDPHFGENYRTEQPHLREYHSELKLNLAPGSHAQGNAIVSMMLEHGVTNEEVRDFLQAGDFRLEALAKASPHFEQALGEEQKLSVDSQVSEPYKTTPQNKYWMKSDVPLEVTFNPNESMNEAFPNMRVVWTDKQGYPSKAYSVEEAEQNSFRITPSQNARVEKMLATFYDGENVIGFRQFYFGVRD